MNWLASLISSIVTPQAEVLTAAMQLGVDYGSLPPNEKALLFGAVIIIDLLLIQWILRQMLEWKQNDKGNWVTDTPSGSTMQSLNETMSGTIHALEEER